MDEDVPTIFQQICLRNKVKFRSLRDHWFTIDEIQWICQEVLRSSSKRYRDTNSADKRTLKKFSDRYNIDEDILTMWVDDIIKGNPIERSLGRKIVQYDSSIMDQVVAWQYSEKRDPNELRLLISKL